MHSTDYAVARCLSVCPIRPSVCHAPVFRLNGYTYPRSFYHRVAPPHQTGWQYLTGTPPTGVECKGGMKKARFSTNISQMMQDRAIVTVEGE